MDKYDNRITEGPIVPSLLRFFLPLWIGAVFQMLYNIVDAAIVGQYCGTLALAAVGGSTSMIISLFVSFFTGISSGASAIIGQFFGGKNDVGTHRAVHTSVAISVIAGGAIMVAGILLCETLFGILGVPDDVMPYATTYIKIYYLGMIFNLLYNFGAGILRAVGDSKRPIYVLAMSVVLNIILDLVFIIYCDMGVAGAALATIISQTFSAIVVVYFLVKADGPYHLSLKKVRICKTTLISIVVIGVPAGFQSTMRTLSNLLFQSQVNSFGSTVMAGWASFNKIDSIFWLSIISFGIAVSTFVAQNFGAGNYDRCKKIVRAGLWIGCLATIGYSIILFAFGEMFLGLFSSEQDVIAVGITIISIYAPLCVTSVFFEILAGSLRGVGNTFVPMLFNIVGRCGVTVIWILLIVPLNPTIQMTCYGYPVNWIITSGLFIIYYLKSDWLNKAIAKKNGALLSPEKQNI